MGNNGCMECLMLRKVGADHQLCPLHTAEASAVAATKRAEEAERAAAWRAHERDSEAKRVGMHMKRAAAAEKRIGELESRVECLERALEGVVELHAADFKTLDRGIGTSTAEGRALIRARRALTPTTGGE